MLETSFISSHMLFGTAEKKHGAVFCSFEPTVSFIAQSLSYILWELFPFYFLVMN